MFDPHLNLFYSYNRDSELIENNLTRAMIVSLKILSGQVRDCLLKALLKESVDAKNLLLPDFAGASFALQGHLDKAKASSYRRKYVVTIASDSYKDDTEKTIGSSIPDGWIFNDADDYCYLIESKVGLNPLDTSQVKSHSVGWLGLKPEEIGSHVISLSWYDVLEAIVQARKKVLLNEQEQIILDALKEYIGFFGYRLFGGFGLEKLENCPPFAIFPARSLDFSGLVGPSAFSLGRANGPN